MATTSCEESEVLSCTNRLSDIGASVLIDALVRKRLSFVELFDPREKYRDPSLFRTTIYKFEQTASGRANARNPAS